MNKQNVSRLLMLTVLICASSMMGCANKPELSAPVSPVTPQAATLPASLQGPISQSSFSKRAKSNMETWQKKLNEFESKP